MTIAVDLGCKAANGTNKISSFILFNSFTGLVHIFSGTGSVEDEPTLENTVLGN